MAKGDYVDERSTLNAMSVVSLCVRESMEARVWLVGWSGLGLGLGLERTMDPSVIDAVPCGHPRLMEWRRGVVLLYLRTCRGPDGFSYCESHAVEHA